MMSPNEAYAVVIANSRPLRTLAKPLYDALGYCLAEDIFADRDLPPANRSAMDGYAVRASDVSACPCNLRLAGEVPAGKAPEAAVAAGTCVRVFTGSNVPDGADAVVMVEKTRQDIEEEVQFLQPVRQGENIRKRGEDARKGSMLLAKSTLLGAAQIGVCASVGVSRPRIWARPSIAILCTGEEICKIDDKAESHQQRNSNGPALRAALATWGYKVDVEDDVPDDLDLLTAKLMQMAAAHDVVLLTGGVSVGKYDLVPEAVRQIGSEIRIHGVSMKPGKPFLYATLPVDRHVFGLPGNPLSVMNSFHEFVLPALRRISGMPAAECRRRIRLPLAANITCKPGRVNYLVSQLYWGPIGPSARQIASMGSGDIVSGGNADGVVIVPSDATELRAGTAVEFQPWRPLP